MKKTNLGKLVKMLKFDEKGLIPAVVQDYKDGKVLMVAYMNEEAFLETVKTGKAHFYSRSRKKLWMKGEESGNIQIVKEILLDCDNDCVLIKVEQVGGASCHTGYRSCFFRKITKDGKLKLVERKIFDPEKVYSRK
ncbi:MAG: phosphoribosyl-AMP cyclohydrolase [Elusimicrobiota bacterium]|nr:phosphoribosyl-AMP cyclohydrolase [Endomicrobiia bacterium]MDW8055941.1 phosphoribosyl-AMP cyclohydrolase [Elusimicrobiota bacterium]